MGGNQNKYKAGDNMTKQIAPKEEQETIVSIDYATKTLIIYTNRYTVAKRIIEKGYKPTKQYKEKGEVSAVEFAVPTKEAGRFLKLNIFRFA